MNFSLTKKQQFVKDVIKQYREEEAREHNYGKELKIYRKGFQDGVDAVRKWLQPSNLPPKNGDYLVTIKKGTEVYVAYTLYQDGWKIYDPRDVIAWMPLPSPYKAGGQNE